MNGFPRHAEAATRRPDEDDAPFASTCMIVQPKTRARASKALTRNSKAQTKGLAKAKAAIRELRVIDAEA